MIRRSRPLWPCAGEGFSCYPGHAPNAPGLEKRTRKTRLRPSQYNNTPRGKTGSESGQERYGDLSAHSCDE
nr:MAG TPA: hypothetical protein [Caudoviricetes sp.]